MRKLIDSVGVCVAVVTLLVGAAYARIPARFRKRMKNIALLVEPEPSAHQLARGHVPRGSTLLGLYEGRPLTARSVFDSFTLPDRITIFQGPHERLARDPVVQQLVTRTEGQSVIRRDKEAQRNVAGAHRTLRRPMIEVLPVHIE